jgi:hypothetical protein
LKLETNTVSKKKLNSPEKPVRDLENKVEPWLPQQANGLPAKYADGSPVLKAITVAKSIDVYPGKWTRFYDMHSGGGLKEAYSQIIIEAPMEEAKVIFYKRFGHNPERVSCTCCGDDYSISASRSLGEATAYHRDCETVDARSGKNPLVNDKWWWIEEGDRRHSDNVKYLTVDEYIALPDVLVIWAKDIKPDEREGEIPEQGYVWRD